MPATSRSKDERSYTITELAQEFDITPRAIRFYEDMALLEPTRRGRNRVYSQRDRTRLKLTLRGKRLGFTLTEIRDLVTMYESPADTGAQLEAFRAALAQHRCQLEQQLEDLQVTLAETDRGYLDVFRSDFGKWVTRNAERICDDAGQLLCQLVSICICQLFWPVSQ